MCLCGTRRRMAPLFIEAYKKPFSAISVSQKLDEMMSGPSFWMMRVDGYCMRLCVLICIGVYWCVLVLDDSADGDFWMNHAVTHA